MDNADSLDYDDILANDPIDSTTPKPRPYTTWVTFVVVGTVLGVCLSIVFLAVLYNNRKIRQRRMKINKILHMLLQKYEEGVGQASTESNLAPDSEPPLPDAATTTTVEDGGAPIEENKDIVKDTEKDRTGVNEK